MIPNPVLMKSVLILMLLSYCKVTYSQYQVTYLQGKVKKIDGRNIQRESEINDIIGKNDEILLEGSSYLILYDIKKKNYNFVTGNGQLSYIDIKNQLNNKENGGLMESVINFSVTNKDARIDLKSYQAEMMKDPNFIDRSGCKENIAISPFHYQSISITSPTGEFTFKWNKKLNFKGTYVVDFMKSTQYYNEQIFLSKELSDTTLIINLDSLLKSNLINTNSFLWNVYPKNSKSNCSISKVKVIALNERAILLSQVLNKYQNTKQTANNLICMAHDFERIGFYTEASNYFMQALKKSKSNQVIEMYELYKARRTNNLYNSSKKRLLLR